MSELQSQSNLGAASVPGSEVLPGIEAPHRGPAYGPRYAIAADHPLVATAALNVMQRGGNAADAAVAAAAMNVVTKPHRTHLGGDAFCLIWRRRENTIDCLNAGGLAPMAASLDRFPNGIPATGPLASTVPGLVDAMLQVHLTYATRSLDLLLAPAIRYAEEGFPVSMRLAGAISMLPAFKDSWSDNLRAAFLKDGKLYAEGETLRQPDVAATLKRIVEDGREGFYEDETAELIARAMSDMGGLISRQDFTESTAVWDDAIMTTYAGCEVYEQALPSQGIILLEALNIIESFPIAEWGIGSADAVHVMVEATKLAFADSRRYVADPLLVEAPAERLLSKDHARLRASEIDMRQGREPMAAMLASDTTEFVVADEDLAIAFIQSVFSPWGSRVLIPGTGIVMNNRLSGFSADPAAANVLAPGKRTVHTLNTFMAMRDGRMVVGGGTPGGDFQVQSNLQTIAAVLNWSLDLQSAVDMPRWVLLDGELAMESRFKAEVMEDLQARGHRVKRLGAWDGNIARSQLMASLPGGGWAVASDLRGEGVALAV
jgi:gamma-glutamyltranspeptidase / glutathione hydrolase